MFEFNGCQSDNFKMNNLILIFLLQYLLCDTKAGEDFTDKNCESENTGVYHEETHSVFKTSGGLCRAILNQTLPVENVEYTIKVEIQSEITVSPGIIFNVIDDQHYDMILFKIDNYDCFEIATVEDNTFSKTQITDPYCGFRMEPNRFFGVELTISGRNLTFNIENNGTVKTYYDILKYPQKPSAGLITEECGQPCEFIFKSLHLLPATQTQYFTAFQGALSTTNNGENELSLFRLDFHGLGYTPNTFCFIALSHRVHDIGPARLYINGNTEHQAGTIKIYNTTAKYFDIYFFSSNMGASHAGFAIDYHVFGCDIQQQDLTFICEVGNHNIGHEDYHRSVEYDSIPGSYRSDDDLQMGWYKFTSCAGNTMPTLPPGKSDICGTRDPIWLDTYDTVSIGYYEGKACTYSDDNDCFKNWMLPYFNCINGERLYYLIPTASPEISAYCVGNRKWCDPSLNETSIDGSGCGTCSSSLIPTLPEPFIMKWVDRGSDGYELQCRIFPETNGIQTEFEVKWEIDYPTHRELIYSEITQSTSFYLHLTIVQHSHLQNNVICVVRGKFVNGAQTSDWFHSEPYFLGLKINSPDTELSYPDIHYVSYGFTLPIHCNGINCMNINDENCSIDVYLVISTKSMTRQPCQNFLYHQPELVAVSDGCSKTIKCNLWNDDFARGFRAKDTIQYGIKPFTHTLYAVSKDKNRNMWNNLVDDVKMHIKTDHIQHPIIKTCTSLNDPHHTTFSHTRYDHHNVEGEFVMYKSEPDADPNMKVLVTAEFDSCYQFGNSPLCNVKVGVRVNNEAIVIDPNNSPTPLRYMGPGYGEPGFQVVVSQHFRKYEVRFPRGDRTTVMVSGKHVNINIESPIEEQLNSARASGLCGKIGRQYNQCDDMYHRNGTRYEFDCLRNSPQIPAFSNAWIAQEEEKIINVVDINRINVNSSLKHYACKVDDIEIFKSANKDFEDAFQEILQIEHCYPYNGANLMYKLREDAAVKQRKRIYAQRRVNHSNHVKGSVYKTEKGTETENISWTEETAMQFCKDYIGLSKVATSCNVTNEIDVEHAVEECALDIMLTGTTDWAIGTLSSLRERCILSIYTNTSMWTFEDKGNETIIKPPVELTDNLCPDDCSGHGDCIVGNCECYEGYTSHDCSQDVTTPPQIEGVFDEGVCNVNECNDIIVAGNGFVSSENLTCHFQSDKVEERIHGTMLNFDSVTCPLPEVRHSVVGYTKYQVSLSNDGKLQSESFTAVVITNECIGCSVLENYDLKCTVKSTWCMIDGTCKPDGEVSTDDACLYCNPREEQHDWSAATAKGCGEGGDRPSEGSGNMTIVIIAACIGVAAVTAVLGVAIYFYYRIRKRQAV